MPENIRQTRKYQAFSEKAAEERFNTVATLFKAASEAEAIHAKKLLKVLATVGSTEKNLEAGLAGETEEYTKMYRILSGSLKMKKERTLCWRSPMR